MDEKIDVSVIVPVWNKSGLTDTFLSAHWMHFRNKNNVQIVIVNNGSTDGTQGVLNRWQQSIKNMKVVTLDENKGFGGGNNIGADNADGNILIFLSNDVTVMGDYITPVVGAVRGVGVLAGARLLSHDTGWNTFPPEKPIVYLEGWCLACNKDVWNRLGGFDERFYPCDYEDIDICYTAQKIGIELKPLMLMLSHEHPGQSAATQLNRIDVTNDNRTKFREKWNL